MEPLGEILRGLPTTVTIAVLSLAIGSTVALPLMLARRAAWMPLRAVAVAVITVARAVPPIVWLFLIFFGLPEQGLKPTPFQAAVVGLGVIAAAYLAEMYRGGVMAVERGQWEAGAALGLSTRDLYRDVIGPQALRVALPGIATFAIIMIKDTSLAYTIGVQEILFRANREAQDGTGSPLLLLGFAAALYTALSLLTALAALRLERRLSAKVAR
jgi:polar amino acid transport system permease protein